MESSLPDKALPFSIDAENGTLVELDDAHLAVIGGGIGDVVPA